MEEKIVFECQNWEDKYSNPIQDLEDIIEIYGKIDKVRMSNEIIKGEIFGRQE